MPNDKTTEVGKNSHHDNGNRGNEAEPNVKATAPTCLYKRESLTAKFLWIVLPLFVGWIAGTFTSTWLTAREHDRLTKGNTKLWTAAVIAEIDHNMEWQGGSQAVVKRTEDSSFFYRRYTYSALEAFLSTTPGLFIDQIEIGDSGRALLDLCRYLNSLIDRHNELWGIQGAVLLEAPLRDYNLMVNIYIRKYDSTAYRYRSLLDSIRTSI